MTIEEKAKAYDEALERARKWEGNPAAQTDGAQRDSIGYELYKIEQALGGDTIIIGGKTKKQNYQKTKQKEEDEN